MLLLLRNQQLSLNASQVFQFHNFLQLLFIFWSFSGTFTSPNDRNLIIAKNNKIEIYTLSPEGLKPIKEISIYGKITVMLLFRPEQVHTFTTFTFS